MRIVVSYDISDDAIRRQVVKVCEAYGQRVQRSVFECALSKDQFTSLRKELDSARKGKGISPSDSIRFYSLCAVCSAEVLVMGHRTATAIENQQVIIG
ncbi:MAG: CRISPR-associated endonuclease Cas2 [Oscillospiraceae bacterium]|jgi:CRISPR-associated protein Cas2|nr:CRISPR-associated endonuclease Cas2 [Oscillospiraceae bacterium]